MNYQAIKDYFLENISQPSTWRGLTLILMASGISVSPENQELIMTIGLFVAGFIGAVVKDKHSKESEQKNDTSSDGSISG